jgi:hypothetical protein
MNGETDERPEDRLADTLAAFDESLASGQADPVALEEAIDPALIPDMRRARSFLWLIEQAWPRAAPAAGESHAFELAAAETGPDPAPAIDAGGTRFGRFEILKTLGQGGFGIVFLAWDPALRRKVALKVPQPGALVTPEAQRRFLREAHAAAGLDHPHIVPVYETGTVDSISYIASAYCEGPTLAAWLARQTRPVAEDQAARLVATLADAVQHAHDRASCTAISSRATSCSRNGRRRGSIRGRPNWGCPISCLGSRTSAWPGSRTSMGTEPGAASPSALPPTWRRSRPRGSSRRSARRPTCMGWAACSMN